MIQNIIVGLLVLGCVAYVLKKFVFKPKKQSCNTDCGKCGGCH